MVFFFVKYFVHTDPNVYIVMIRNKKYYTLCVFFLIYFIILPPSVLINLKNLVHIILTYQFLN